MNWSSGMALSIFQTHLKIICWNWATPHDKTFIIIYKTINLSTILHDLEISSLVLREIHRLRLFENCVLSEMGHMDLTQSKQQDGENCIKRFTICNFTQYCHKDQTKENWLGGACNVHGEDEKFIQSLARNFIGKIT